MIGSLCTGYGGLDMAVQALFRVPVAWSCDVDRDVQHLHRHNHPDVPMFGDVATVNWSKVPPVGILTAGYPCQPFSVAGSRKGTVDERHIFPHIAEAIRVLRPGVVVLENVRGHLSLGFGDVLGALAGLGYDAGWAVVRASDAGAPHNRARVFIVARDASGPGRQRVDSVGHASPGRSPVHEAHCALNEWDWGVKAGAIRRWHDLHGCVPAPLLAPKRINPVFVEWVMGLPRGWVTDPAKWEDWRTPSGRKSRGGHLAAQLRILGNGVCPQQAVIGIEEAWRNLVCHVD